MTKFFYEQFAYIYYFPKSDCEVLKSGIKPIKKGDSTSHLFSIRHNPKGPA